MTIHERFENTYTTGEGDTIWNVHLPEQCEGPCPTHSPSNHHMRSWQTGWRSHGGRSRDANGFMVRLCEHGVEHVDPDEMFPPLIHTCDGCCIPRSATDSYGSA